MSKKKIQNVLTLTDIFKYHKDKFKDTKFELDYKKFRLICETFNKYIMTDIIDNGGFFRLPFRIGVIRIKKREVNLDHLKKDYGLFNKSEGNYKNGHINEHTNNLYVRFHWSKFYTDNMIKNKTYYSFIPTRTNKRYLASLLKNDGMKQMNKYFN